MGNFEIELVDDLWEIHYDGYLLASFTTDEIEQYYEDITINNDRIDRIRIAFADIMLKRMNVNPANEFVQKIFLTDLFKAVKL